MLNKLALCKHHIKQAINQHNTSNYRSLEDDSLEIQLNEKNKQVNDLQRKNRQITELKVELQAAIDLANKAMIEKGELEYNMNKLKNKDLTQNEIDLLKNDFNAVSTESRTLKDNYVNIGFNTHENNVTLQHKNIEAKIDELKIEIEEKTCLISNLKHELNAKVNELGFCNNELNIRNEQIEKLNIKMKEKSIEYTTLNKTLDQKECDLHNYKGLLDTKRIEIDK